VSDRFVVEVDKQVVGIGVQVDGGFKFFSSDLRFNELEGKVFTRARSLAHEVTEHGRARSRQKQVSHQEWF
jgi:hypothetical protein